MKLKNIGLLLAAASQLLTAVAYLDGAFVPVEFACLTAIIAAMAVYLCVTDKEI